MPERLHFRVQRDTAHLGKGRQLLYNGSRQLNHLRIEVVKMLPHVDTVAVEQGDKLWACWGIELENHFDVFIIVLLVVPLRVADSRT